MATRPDKPYDPNNPNDPNNPVNWMRMPTVQAGNGNGNGILGNSHAPAFQLPPMAPPTPPKADSMPDLTDEVIRALADAETRRSMLGRTRKSAFTSNPISNALFGG